MSMFDRIFCEIELPPEASELQNLELQTKDTPAQILDTYIIARDGTLFHIDYDIEDRSDPNAEEIQKLWGSMTKVNERKVLESFTGDIEFYGKSPKTGKLKYILASFKDGILIKPLAVSES